MVAISPEKPARDAGPDCAFRRHHPIHRTVGDIARGGVRGGNPLPGKENHTGPPTGLPRRSGGSRGKSPGGADAAEPAISTQAGDLLLDRPLRDSDPLCDNSYREIGLSFQEFKDDLRTFPGNSPLPFGEPWQ